MPTIFWLRYQKQMMKLFGLERITDNLVVQNLSLSINSKFVRLVKCKTCRQKGIKIS